MARRAQRNGIDAAEDSGEDAAAGLCIFLQHRAPEEASVSTLEKTSWKAMELEKLSDKITRQMISGENATLSQLLLKRGADVPRHSHVNEQY